MQLLLVFFPKLSFRAGVSALVSCPAEFLMIQQQKSGRPLGTEARLALSTLGPLKLFKGLGPTMVSATMPSVPYDDHVLRAWFVSLYLLGLLKLFKGLGPLW